MSQSLRRTGMSSSNFIVRLTGPEFRASGGAFLCFAAGGLVRFEFQYV
jgi:hypothetical protein